MVSIEDYDYKRAVIHERAHAEVAKFFGADAWWEVRPTGEGGRDVKHWVGNCTIDTRSLTDQQRRIVGLAGLIAEMMIDDPGLTADDAALYLEEEVVALSETDAALASGYDYYDINESVALVRQFIQRHNL